MLALGATAQDRLEVTDEGRYLGTDPPVFVPAPVFATWVAYHDGKRISEPDFYRILGEEDLATSAEAWLVWKKGLGWGGLGVIGTGLAAAIATELVGRGGAGDLPFFTALGSIVGGGGLWIAYFSLGFNYEKLDFARMRAEEYNAKRK